VKYKKHIVGGTLGIIIGVIILVLYIHFSTASIIEIIHIPIDLEFQGNMRKMGFNVDTDGLHFGTLGPGVVGRKDIVLNNTADEPVRVELKTFGSLRPNIFYEDNYFILNGNSNRSLMIRAVTPATMKKGFYNSTLRVIFRKI
tara:strand:+ start:410 stop:838 length:429 start_codon:yes stop_codon:yes gene_type:complete